MFILYDPFNIIHAFHSCYVLKQFRLLFIVSLKSHDESPVYLMHIPVEPFEHRHCALQQKVLIEYSLANLYIAQLNAT